MYNEQRKRNKNFLYFFFVQQQNMRVFLCLFLLGVAIVCQGYQLQVTLQKISEGVVSSQASNNTCSKIVAISDHLFHVNTGSIYRSWNLGNLNGYMTQQSLYNSSQTIKDFEVNPKGRSAVFSINSSATLKVFVLNADHTYNTNKNVASFLSVSPDCVFIDDTYIYTFYIQGSISGRSTIEVIEEASGSLIQTINLSQQYYRMSISPDFTQAVCWTSQTGLIFIGLPWLDIRGNFYPQSTPPTGWTSKVSFSCDSTLVVIETDQVNPVLVLSMSNYSIVYSVQISHTIVEAHFLNCSNDFLVIISTTSRIIIDMTVGQVYQQPADTATSYFVKENYIFQCKNNTISQTYVALQYPSNTSLNTTPSNNNSNSNVPSQSSAEQLYYQLSLSNGQFSAIQAVNNSLAVTTAITGTVVTFVNSMPITIYFLSFHNYFTLSSLYILLDFPIPQHIYRYLVLLYNSINSNFLGLLGLQIQIPSLSEERVNRQRPLFFKISSDVSQTNTIALVMLTVNIALISVARWISSKFPKGNAIRVFMIREYKLMVCGQITNVLVQFTLPWSFILLNNGVPSFRNKANFATYLLLLFVAIFFPIYYLYQLIHHAKTKMSYKPEKKVIHTKQQKINKLSKPYGNKKQYRNAVKNLRQVHFQDKLKRKQPQKTQILKNPQNTPKDLNLRQKQISNRVNKTKERRRPSSLQNLLTQEVIEQWYLCEVNFLLPVLVLLPNPISFLVVVMFVLIVGSWIAFKKKTHKANYFVLSLYQLGFHICFLCFYWCKSAVLLSIVELFCLILYLLGSIHYSITFIYEVTKFLYKLFKDYCKPNKVSPLKPSAIVADKQRKYNNIKGEQVTLEGELIKKVKQSGGKEKKRKVKKTRQLVPTTRIQWIKSKEAQEINVDVRVYINP